MDFINKYPIGKFIAPEIYTDAYILEKINEIADFPEKIKSETLLLTNEQLDTQYRPEGFRSVGARDRCFAARIRQDGQSRGVL